jgi:hypothetical protein
MKPLDQLADAHFTEACHLELTGLTDADDRCGGCHHRAGDHRHWKHRARENRCVRCRMHVHADLRVCPMCDPLAGIEFRPPAVPPYIPPRIHATPENVRAAVMGEVEGVYVIALPEDVREVGQALYAACSIFWMNPKRSASRWKAKDAVQHMAAGCSHALQHMRGRVLDPDTGKPHLHLAAARMLLAVAQLSAGKGGV